MQPLNLVNFKPARLVNSYPAPTSLDLQSRRTATCENEMGAYSLKKNTSPNKRPKTLMSLTLFSWGYSGWGNAIPQLLRATASVERNRGFEAPMFVDIRMNRAVRAIGFRGATFEKRLGHSRYRWMRSLGNSNIGRGGKGIKINCPDTVNQLLDLAIDAEEKNRRIIFFCSCQTPQWCHRHSVTKLILRAAKRRGISLNVVEWPGGELPVREQLKVAVSPEVWRGLLSGFRKAIPVGFSALSKALRLPWGSVVRVECRGENVPISVGPARYNSGHWSLPVFLFPVEADDRLKDLIGPAIRLRESDGYKVFRS